jgi:hypothetical protein
MFLLCRQNLPRMKVVAMLIARSVGSEVWESLPQAEM